MNSDRRIPDGDGTSQASYTAMATSRAMFGAVDPSRIAHRLSMPRAVSPWTKFEPRFSFDRGSEQASTGFHQLRSQRRQVRRLRQGFERERSTKAAKKREGPEARHEHDMTCLRWLPQRAQLGWSHSSGEKGMSLRIASLRTPPLCRCSPLRGVGLSISRCDWAC